MIEVNDGCYNLFVSIQLSILVIIVVDVSEIETKPWSMELKPILKQGQPFIVYTAHML